MGKSKFKGEHNYSSKWMFVHQVPPMRLFLWRIGLHFLLQCSSIQLFLALRCRRLFLRRSQKSGKLVEIIFKTLISFFLIWKNQVTLIWNTNFINGFYITEILILSVFKKKWKLILFSVSIICYWNQLIAPNCLQKARHQ